LRAQRRRHDAKPHRKKTQRGDFKERRRRYNEKHIDRIRLGRIAFERRRRSDPIQRVVDSIRRRIRHVIKGGKSKGLFILLGYSGDELRQHIESLFQTGMTWENYGLYGERWHLDHKRPVSSFNLPEQLLECFALKNMQPLWAKDNLSKHSTWEAAYSLADPGSQNSSIACSR
jgi:hypothetical protein